MSENAIAELQAIEGEDDFFSLGEVPPDWCANRMMGTASAEGNDAEICGGVLLPRIEQYSAIPELNQSKHFVPLRDPEGFFRYLRRAIV